MDDFDPARFRLPDGFAWGGGRRASRKGPKLQVKQKHTHQNPFVQVPLWWAEQAARITGTPKAFVWVWLLRLAFETKSNTFPLPNERLRNYGVDRRTKYRTLRELEAAGLIQVNWRKRKSPIVTLPHLSQIGT